jgi:glycosyltransferase involved in cell wall biosynthesis
MAKALDAFANPDVIHDNGIWLPYNHALASHSRRTGVPRLVSLRGMLEPWSMRHRAWKKQIAWTLYQRRDLATADHLHATADQEAENLKPFGFSVPVTVIPNGIDIPAHGRDWPTAEGQTRKALFLSRIHPKKGLPLLIEAWARIAPSGWVLDIAGPDENGHQAEVQRMIDARGLSDVVSFVGPLHGRQKDAAYQSADLFVLPTYSENFGMAVAEALAHGVPVLTTTGAPWAALKTHRCGWWVEPTEEGVTEGLREALSTPATTLAAMGVSGRQFASASFSWDSVARDFVVLYEQITRLDSVRR